MLHASMLLLATLCIGQAAPDTTTTPVYIGGQSGYHTYRIPALVTAANGDLLAFCEGRKTSASDAGDIDLLLRRSSDKGATWTPVQVIHEEGGDAPITIGNPCPIVDRTTDRVHLLFCRNNAGVFYVFSDDHGATWSKPREITASLDGFDFPWTRVGTGPGHGLHLTTSSHKDRLIVPIWLNEKIRVNYRAATIYSDDHGATWHTGGLIGSEIADTNECMAYETQIDGKPAIALNMRARSSHTRSIATSTDGGKNWSVPTAVKNLPDPVCQAAILRHRTSEGEGILLFSNPADAESRVNMTVRTSRDEGKTWPDAKRLHTGPSGYSDLTELSDGSIGCLYECGDENYHQRIVFARFNPFQQ